MCVLVCARVFVFVFVCVFVCVFGCLGSWLLLSLCSEHYVCSVDT